MRRRRPPLPSSLMTHVMLLLLGSGVLNSVTATVVSSRWGQSSLLLSPSSSPNFLVISGKSYVAGQTVDSTASTSSSLLLSLASAIDDLSNPPWVVYDTGGPITAYSSAIALSDTAALVFGGDATGDSSVPVQTANDSSWALSVSASTPLSLSWTHEPALWDSQPERRMNAFSTSATNGTVSRGWFFGGEKSDGSGLAFDELWEFAIAVDSSGNVGAGVWESWTGQGGPPAMYDGVAVLVTNSSSTTGLPSIFLIGGVELLAGAPAMTSLSDIWVFIPSLEVGGGSWTQVSTTGAPATRRGHVAVDVGNGKIWIQGGRSLDGTSVFSDSAVLDVESGVWSITSNAGQAAWGQSAAVVGNTVLVAFGYGANGPASTTLGVYSPSNDTWLNSYVPSFAIASSNPKSTGTIGSLSSSSAQSLNTDANSQSGSLTSSTPAGQSSMVGGVVGTGTSPPNSNNPLFSSSSQSATNVWTVPGGVASAGSSPPGTQGDGNNSNTSNTPSDSDDNKPTPLSKSAVAGIVLSALVVLALGGGSLLLARKRRRQTYRCHGRGARGRGEVSGSLIAEHRMEKATPVALRTLGVVDGGRRMFSGLWQAGAEGRRFDMLRDEESEHADAASRRDGSTGSRWTTFDSEPAGDEDYHASSLAGRGGMAIWDGFGSPRGAPLGRSASSRSFLSSALGPFAGSSTVRSDTSAEDFGHGEKDVGDAGLLLPAIDEEWEEDSRSRGGEETTSSNDHSEETGGTRTTRSTGSKSTGSQSFPDTTMSSGPSTSSSSKALRLSALSPSASLYGSTFATTRPLSSPSDENDQLKRNSSWWNRLSRSASLSSPTATAAERIRDPAPPPLLDVIKESSVSASDPFVDPSRPPPSATVDEQGRRVVPGKAPSREPSQKTMSSVGSSAFEEVMRGMDVVQRAHTPSGSISSSQESNSVGHGRWNRSQDRSMEIQEVVWNGTGEPLSPFADPLPRTTSPDPFGDPNPAVPSTSRRSPPPRLPPLQIPSPSSPTKVRAMVHKFEQKRLSISELPPPPSPSSLPASTSFGNVRKATLDLDDRERKTSTSRVRVGHGLAKKPTLFVANPDDGL